MNKYITIISIWFAVSLITLLLFKYIPRKMKETDDKQTKNTLYTILIFLGLPMLLLSVLTPPVFIIGDKDMNLAYDLIWGGLCMIFVIYFIIKQRSGKDTGTENRIPQ